MQPRPTVLTPATPSKLLSNIVSHYRHPTTLLIGSSKDDFLQALVCDVQHQPTGPSSIAEAQPQDSPPASNQPHHPLLTATLLQLAVARHIRTVFIPSVAHLRAYLSALSPTDSKLPAPPPSASTATTPALLVYGLLELHRGASEWSAQGIGASLAALVDAAARSGFRAVAVEPGTSDGLDGLLAEEVPLLNGTPLRDDGAWTGRTVSVRRVFARWFDFGACSPERPGV